MNVIIAGGRHFQPTPDHNSWLIEKIKRLGTRTVFCGMATGADEFGYTVAKAMGIDIKEFEPNWNKYGRSAGPIRNEEMAKMADACILFPGGIGTDDMRKRAIEHKLILVEYRDE